MTENIKKELVQRIVRNLLDIQILRLIKTEPMWGYKIKKQVAEKFDVKLRHGALYPLLNSLEKDSFLTSEKQSKGGRTRKVYMITQKGMRYLEVCDSILKEQLNRKAIE